MPYFFHESVHTTLGVEDLLGAGEEGVVATPDVDVDLRLGGACGHDHFAVADHLGVGIPGGMNVGLWHTVKKNQRLEN